MLLRRDLVMYLYPYYPLLVSTCSRLVGPPAVWHIHSQVFFVFLGLVDFEVSREGVGVLLGEAWPSILC
jgi:hypothetical protein